jgi:hypothetical protein
MFVSVVDLDLAEGEPATYALVEDDGVIVAGGFPSRQMALAELRLVWLTLADVHGFDLTSADLFYSGNEYLIDGMDPEDWIRAWCGCGEDGGTLGKHVG